MTGNLHKIVAPTCKNKWIYQLKANTAPAHCVFALIFLQWTSKRLQPKTPTSRRFNLTNICRTNVPLRLEPAWTFCRSCLCLSNDILHINETFWCWYWGPLPNTESVKEQHTKLVKHNANRGSQTARSMGPIWDPPGSCWSQIGPMLVPWTLLSGLFHPTSAKQIRRKLEWDPPTHQMKMMLPIKINLLWQCVERSLLHTWNNNWCRRMNYKLWFKQPQFIFPISNVVCKQNVISHQCTGYLVSAFS